MKSIKEKVSELPTQSGVYVMHDKDGTIIYIGKAKNLKNRVSSYFINTKKQEKVMAMVEKVADFEYYVVPSELDAFVLERNLIYKHQPFYNILLKDNKAYPYIKVDIKNPFPRFEITRKLKSDGSRYFGPYFGGVRINDVLNAISLAFPLRQCTNTFLKRSHTKECLNYHLGLCSAPCTKRITSEEYSKYVQKAIRFLSGEQDEVRQVLENKMQNYAESENFEKAIEIRNTLSEFDRLKKKILVQIPKDLSADFVGLASDGVYGAVCVVIVRGGKVLSIINNNICDASLTEEEMLENYLLEFYNQNITAPKEIYVSHQLNQEITKSTISSKIIYSQKGQKHSLVEMAVANAKHYLDVSLEKEKRKFNSTIGALKILKKELGLTKIPNRIECYDISHISGTNKVGSMVVFTNGEPNKKHYRKFKIKEVEGNNDFESLKEVLFRREKEFQDGKDLSYSQQPDLIVIDGGKGQLSSVLQVLDGTSLGSSVIISLAKREEEVFLPHEKAPVLLAKNSQALKLLQRIRDEAHRFAITFHRELRAKTMTQTKKAQTKKTT